VIAREKQESIFLNILHMLCIILMQHAQQIC